MTDILAEPDLNPFTRDKYSHVVVRALKIHRDPETNEIVEYEQQPDLSGAHCIGVYAFRTAVMVDAGATPSIWLADFDPSMVWAIPGFVDGLGLEVDYDFYVPADNAPTCDSVTNKETTND